MMKWIPEGNSSDPPDGFYSNHIPSLWERGRETDRQTTERGTFYIFGAVASQRAHIQSGTCAVTYRNFSTASWIHRHHLCVLVRACAVHQFQGHEQFKTPAGFFRCCVSLCVCVLCLIVSCAHTQPSMFQSLGLMLPCVLSCKCRRQL